MEKAITTLKPVDGQPHAESALLKQVFFDSHMLCVQVNVLQPARLIVSVTFSSIVGLRILDEIDLPQFWHNYSQILGENTGVVFEVLAGGWFVEQRLHSPIMDAGAYADLREWVVLSEDWCVSVLAEQSPKIIASDASPL